MRIDPDTTAVPASWVVVARHRKHPAGPESETPWGTFHLLQEGSLLTACGLPSAAWFRFKGVRTFRAADGDTCPACAAVVTPAVSAVRGAVRA